jgi:hypothetical protein
MRSTIMLLTLALLYGCAARSPTENEAEFVTRIGVIKGKQVIDPENAGSDKQVNTSVHASVSSGSGLSIGLGFLVSAMSDGSSQVHPVRYQVELLDGEPITVYHESDLFEVEDCVEISSMAGDDETPPLMKRIKGGC